MYFPREKRQNRVFHVQEHRVSNVFLFFFVALIPLYFRDGLYDLLFLGT